VKSGLSARVKAAVCIDMVGDKDLRLSRDEYSTPWLYEAFASAARQNGLGQHVDGKRERIADDHQSFLDVGIPAVDLIDFDYGPNNSYWHTENDTLANCSRASLAAIGRIVLLGLPAIENKLAPR
jgi:Zn-dependent M28 family amino/carboxypeptidase